MNMRQKKKEFKKKYGYNPINIHKKQVKFVKIFIKNLKTTVKRFVQVVKRVPKILQSTVITIQMMPEDEFNEKLNGLSIKEKELAIKIREKRKI